MKTSPKPPKLNCLDPFFLKQLSATDVINCNKQESLATVLLFSYY